MLSQLLRAAALMLGVISRNRSPNKLPPSSVNNNIGSVKRGRGEFTFPVFYFPGLLFLPIHPRVVSAEALPDIC